MPLEETPMTDYMIRVGSPLGKRWGFMPERFEGYLWRHGNIVTISWIISHRNVEADFCELIEQILAGGYTVQVLIDSTWRDVCKRLGFVETNIPFARYGGVWVWEKKSCQKE